VIVSLAGCLLSVMLRMLLVQGKNSKPTLWYTPKVPYKRAQSAATQSQLETQT
jgi:hypothetical protein